MAPVPFASRGLTLFASAVLAHGCSFFEELQSAESAEDGDDDDESDDEDEGASSSDASHDCAWPEDDFCIDQDRLLRCDPETHVSTLYDCGAVCGSLVNMACVNSASGHACFCATPGAQRQSVCTELEACLGACTNPTDRGCTERCFARSDRGTIRLYGALVHCAHAQCDATCNATPELCAACITTGMRAGTGECALARSVCDEHARDDPFEDYD